MRLYFFSHNILYKIYKNKQKNLYKMRIDNLVQDDIIVLQGQTKQQTSQTQKDLNRLVSGAYSSENSDCKRLNTCKVKIRHYELAT